jgi:hypothetical protein
MKATYEAIAFKADYFFTRAIFAKSVKETFYWINEYKEFLFVCGWTVQEFDLELLRRIDNDWIKIYNDNVPIIIWD